MPNPQSQTELWTITAMIHDRLTAPAADYWTNLPLPLRHELAAYILAGDLELDGAAASVEVAARRKRDHDTNS